MLKGKPGEEKKTIAITKLVTLKQNSMVAWEEECGKKKFLFPFLQLLG